MIVEIDAYKGPLDLLISLIEKDKIDIYNIPINHITESYLSSIEGINEDSENMIDFIVMASTLIEIKSKMLLPSQVEEEIDPREDLVQRLLEYQKAKKSALILEELKAQADLSYTRHQEEFIITKSVINIEEDISLLTQIFHDLLMKTEGPYVKKEILSSEAYKVDDYMVILKEALDKKSRLSLDDFIYKGMEKGELIVYFLALLELVKLRKIRVKSYDQTLLLIKRNDLYG